MKRLTQLLDGLLYSNIFIGLCAVALAFTNQLTVEGDFYLDQTCWFIFFSTIFTYSFLKFRGPGDNVQGNYHQNWAAEYPQLSRNLLLISGIATTAFFFRLSREQQLIVGVLAFITCFYGFVPIPFLQSKKKLRNFGLLKTIFVGLVWSVTTVAVPLAGLGVGGETLAFLLLRRFLFVMALTLIFEIKDMAGDSHYNIRTVPMAIGVVNTKLFAQGILFLLMLIIIIQYFFYDISLANMLAINLSLFITILCVQAVNEQTGERYYYLVLDGMMILQFLLVYAGVKWIG